MLPPSGAWDHARSLREAMRRQLQGPRRAAPLYDRKLAPHRLVTSRQMMERDGETNEGFGFGCVADKVEATRNRPPYVSKYSKLNYIRAELRRQTPGFTG